MCNGTSSFRTNCCQQYHPIANSPMHSSHRPSRVRSSPITAAVRSTTSLHEHYMSAEAARAAATLEVLPPPPTPATDNRPSILNMAHHRALVLDSSYRPIEVISWQKAICMDLFDKVYCESVYMWCTIFCLSSWCSTQQALCAHMHLCTHTHTHTSQHPGGCT